MRPRNWVVLSIAVAAALLLIGRVATALIVDRAWFHAFGADPVFWEQFVDSFLLRGGLWLAGTLFAFANLHAVRRTILAIAVPSRVANIEMTAMLPPRRLLAITVVAAALMGLLLIVPFDDWTPVALARHGVPFGEIEGYLNQDLGFYVYWLPLEETLYVWALLAIVVMTAVILLLYALTRSLRLEGKRIVASTHVRRHLTVLGALVVLLLAWSYRLDAFDLLRVGSGTGGVFRRVDHKVTLVIDRALSMGMFCASFLLLRAGWLGHVRTALVTLTLVIVGALGLRHLVPALVAQGVTLGDQVKREQDYVSTRVLVSRRAYDVDKIVIAHPDSGTDRVPEMRLADLPGAVSVWDASQLSRALRPSSAAITSVEPLAWTRSGDALRALLLQRPTAGGPWSVVTVDATSVDARGAPVHDGGDAGVDVDSSAISVTEDSNSGSILEPLIYPGATGHRLVTDSTTRVVGARLDAWGVRIAHAWATRDPRLLGEGVDDAVPTLVLWRDVRERVRRLAPVFAQGNDVLPMMFEGTLYWTVELYSASESYPLSQRFLLAGDFRSYFRHAATALVESRTGRVRLVGVSDPDPIARTWMALAPQLFVPVSRLPAGQAQLLPPPTDGAMAQVRAFALYGSRLDGPSRRHVPDSAWTADTPPAMLVGGRSPGVGWSVPLLNGPELIAGVAVATGGARRGTRWLPVAAPSARWSALAGRLHAALDSSRSTFVEGSRREPRFTFGPVRTVLVKGAPVLAQPLYVDRLNGIPALVRVGVATVDATAIGSSMREAVQRLPGSAEDAPVATTPPGGQRANLAREVVIARLYDTMRSAIRRGDWTRFGSAFDSLGALVGRPPDDGSQHHRCCHVAVGAGCPGSATSGSIDSLIHPSIFGDRVNLHEYQAKELLRAAGVPIPPGEVARTPDEVEAIAKRYGTAVMVKAQVHVGGRGKAGGVKFCPTPDAAREKATAILGMDIKGLTVEKVLVTPAADIGSEAYVGIIVDRATKKAVFMVSAAGGIDIEEVAATTPEKILYYPVDPRYGLQSFEALRMGFFLYPDAKSARAAAKIMQQLYTAFVNAGCSLAEINPLVVTTQGDVVALDGKMVIDDNELDRRPDIAALRDESSEEPSEVDARNANLTFIKLDGNVGCVVNGAGLAMATMDLVKYYGGDPANFLDIGGSSNPEKVVNALRIITSDPNVKCILFNIFGGITRTDDVANGIVTATKANPLKVPIVIRLTGTNEEIALQILKENGFSASSDMDAAVQRAVELATKGAAA